MSEDIKVIISALLKDEQFQAGIKGMNDSIDKHGNKSESMFKQLKLGWLAVAAAITGTIYALKNIVKETIEAEKNTNQLAQALRNAGTFSNELMKSYKKQADELSRLLGIDDDLITKSQAIFTAYGVQKSQMKDLIKATADFASVKGMDLASASDLVAKSVGGEVNALGRYGIAIDGSLQGTERISAAIDGLNQRFGGQAALAAETFEGKINKIGVAFNNAKEDIGKGIIQGIQPGIDSLLKFINTAEGMEKISSVTKVIASAFVILGSILSGVLKNVISIIGYVKEQFITTKDFFANIFTDPKKAFEELGKMGKSTNDFLKEQWDITKSVITDSAAGINKIFDDNQNYLITKAQDTTTALEVELTKRAEMEKAKAEEEKATLKMVNDFKVSMLDQSTQAIVKGLLDEKATTKGMFADMIRMAGDQISAILGIKAMAAWAEALINPLAIPGAIGLSAATAGVKVLAGQLASAIEGSYASGIAELPGDMVAQVHAGERIIPASMNIPNMSNESFMAATYRGIGSSPGASSVVNNNSNQTTNINLNGIGITADRSSTLGELLNMADRMGTRLFQRV